MTDVDPYVRLAQLLPKVSIGKGVSQVDATKPCTVQLLRMAAGDYPVSAAPPSGVSPVLSYWLVVVQDSMTHEARNSARWRDLLPLAFNTRDHNDAQRVRIWQSWFRGLMEAEGLSLNGLMAAGLANTERAAATGAGLDVGLRELRANCYELLGRTCLESESYLAVHNTFLALVFADDDYQWTPELYQGPEFPRITRKGEQD